MTSWRTFVSTGACLLLVGISALALPPDWPGAGPDQKLIGDYEKSLAVRQSAQTGSAAAGSVLPSLEVEWVGSPQWMTGINFGGDAFGNSFALGLNFFGSNIEDSSYIPVVIEFSSDSVTLGQVFRRDLSYAANGVGQFPGMVWDVSNPGSPRRLNVCMVEDAGTGTPNLLWDPSSSGFGKREYLFIMDSDYDGTGTTYAGFNLLDDASAMDIQYGWWPAVEPGHALLESLPASMEVNPRYVRNIRAIPSSGELLVTWSFNLSGADRFRVYYGTSSPPANVDSVGGSVHEFLQTGLTDGVTYYYEVEAVNASGIVIATSAELATSPQEVASNMTLSNYWHGRGTYGDIWGYVDQGSGTEYALICARNEGVSVIDLDQDPPVEVGFMPGIVAGNDTKDVKVYDHYAIVIAENEAAQIFDLTDPANPVQVSTIDPPGGGSHNCLVEGDYLYIIGDHDTGGLLIYDISSPAAPDSVGSFAPFYYHDVDIRNDTVCATGIYGDGVDLIDVSNKTSPSLVGRFNYSGSGAHNAEYSADGNYVFIGDEIGSSGNWTRVFDVSDPTNVQLVNELIIDPSAVMHNCYLLEDTLLVMGHYSEGVRIWNVSDPVNATEVAYYDTYTPAQYGYVGCWSVYPYLPSGRIIASDMQTGLYVLERDAIQPSGCCVGLTGNVNNDAMDNVTLTDLTVLVNHLFVTFDPLPCPEEANTSGDASGNITLTDLTVLVNTLFVTFSPPAACQ